eukprot:TRINITY_DN5342_c0_g4_i1.p1 TRINITY_DN5342_c0_g4~~TRINITY_DN5342_c0_g4_i1.p1  ORF type:complete len:339 (-),score=99.56 TRINITY_DN5342_c0_g4_i1:127-1119(-)
MIRRPPRSTLSSSSAASDVYKRQPQIFLINTTMEQIKMKYGQVVIGAPGSGKSTYCAAMDQFLTALNRSHILVNLDPASEDLKYTPTIDIEDLIRIEDVQSTLQLGPNGSLLYCLDFLHANIEWLYTQIRNSQADYFIIDTPGQVETYSIDSKLKEILELVKRNCGMELACVHLTDSRACTDSALFMSSMLVALSATVNLELPFVSFLSKMDLIEQYGDLPFPLEYYTEELEPSMLSELICDEGSVFGKKYSLLTKKLCDLINGYCLVSYTALDITDKLNMSNALQLVDKANGYAYKEFAVGSEVMNIEKFEKENREATERISDKMRGEI